MSLQWRRTAHGIAHRIAWHRAANLIRAIWETSHRSDGKLGGYNWKMTYVHSYDTTFQGAIALWKGPIVELVFLF